MICEVLPSSELQTGLAGGNLILRLLAAGLWMQGELLSIQVALIDVPSGDPLRCGQYQGKSIVEEGHLMFQRCRDMPGLKRHE